MLLVILALLCMTLYAYYSTLWPRGLVREFIISTLLLSLVAGLYCALALGVEFPAVFSLMHQAVQNVVQR